MDTLISYPCAYLIKVIITQYNKGRGDEIIDIVADITTVIKTSLKHSEHQQFSSLSITLQLENEPMMAAIFEKIKAKSYVKLVL